MVGAVLLPLVNPGDLWLVVVMRMGAQWSDLCHLSPGCSV